MEDTLCFLYRRVVDREYTQVATLLWTIILACLHFPIIPPFPVALILSTARAL